MPDFLIAAVVKVQADSEAEAVKLARVLEQESQGDELGVDLTIPTAARVEVDPDTIPEPTLLDEQEMDVHPPLEGNLETAEMVWLRTHEQHGIRVDLYDVQRSGSRGLPLFGYRLSWLHTSVEPDHADNRWEVIFTGEDLEPGPLHDDDEILADLLGFLSSYDELTDSEITPRQYKWLSHYRDELSIWSAELEGETR